MQELPTALLRHAYGQEVFAKLLKRWMSRSGWSYAAMEGLAEAAVIALEAPAIPTMEAGLSIARAACGWPMATCGRLATM
jgi:hypothetical protein